MSTDQQDRTGSRWAWLLALPVVCCAAHAVLLALGAGSLAVIGGTTGRTLLVAVGVVTVMAAVVVVLVRGRSQA